MRGFFKGGNSPTIMARLLVALAILFIGRIVHGEITNVGWWKNTVFYQIYPRSFMDYDGDGVGDLAGINAKLEHFRDIGVGGVWLSPIYTSPMVDFGYDIANFTEIDPLFGTMADFENLVKTAKEQGLKVNRNEITAAAKYIENVPFNQDFSILVILDFVPNHTSNNHEWFEKSIRRESPYEDFYIWHNGTVEDDGTPILPNNWISVFSGPAWTFDETRQQWYFHQFAAQQPDLNYRNPAVQEEMKNVLRFWLEKGVDGFRIDAVPHLVEAADFRDEPVRDISGVNSDDYAYLDHIYTKDDELTYEIMREWRQVLDDYTNETNSDEKVLMTEAYTNLTMTLKYYDYGSQIPFNFKFVTEIGNTSTPTDFKDAIDVWLDGMPEDGVANWVMGNHDRSRTASRYPGRADQMTMLAMILPGVAVTYYGEEIGMIDTYVSWEDTQDPQACNTDADRFEAHTRDPNRSPFQWDATTSAGFSSNRTTWLPVNANYRTLNLAQEKLDTYSHYKIYKSLIKLKSQSTLREGSNEVSVINDTILAVTRTLTEEAITNKVILLINFDDNVDLSVNLVESNITSSSEVATIYTSSIGYQTTEGDSIDVTNVKLPAKSSLVILSRSGAGQLCSSVLVMVLAMVFKNSLL